MRSKRFIQTIKLHIFHGKRRDKFMKNAFGGYGDKVSYFPKIMPLYLELLKFHNNIVIASGVNFITHDAIHVVLNNMEDSEGKYKEQLGCIEIMDNVFIGAFTSVFFDVRIESNVIIGANSLVNTDLKANGVYVGIPVRRICSFDEFMNTRKSQKLKIGINKSQNLDKKEIDSLWKVFEKNHI